MSRADRKLHLELLRARAAAERIELALAVQDISDRFESLRRAADWIGSIAGALGSRRRTLRWLALGAAAFARARWLRRAAAGALGVLRSNRRPIRALSLAAVAALAALLLRPRSTERGASSEGNRGDHQADHQGDHREDQTR